MATHLARFEHAGHLQWGVVQGAALAPLEGTYPTTAALIARGEPDWRAAASRAPTVALASVRLHSPVTTPARVVCQGANYRQHMLESGLDPDHKRYNMFFEKSDASVAPPVGTIVRPAHVRLLDYELELALVMRRQVSAPVTVTARELSEYVFGFTIANDVSARDVQLPQTQFFKGKSYRGFCPLGPYLAVPEPEEFAALDRLTLTLWVNDQVRQQDTTANLVYKPAETMTELSGFCDLSPGDVLLTGTPAGCALRAPPPLVRRLMQALLPEPTLWATFVQAQSRRPQYLRPGDVVRATIRSDDGRIDLGEQRHRVEQGTP
jgi:2-keto-4-pentenoate hydratase/2-oxohepta-3-ene-1,7-dioic acid hydratase in catechol pathway